MADDDETHFEIRRVQYGRMPLGPDQLFFKPCLVYQKLLDEHVVDAGLELRVDMSTGLILCGNQPVRRVFTKSFLGDDAADLAPSRGEEPASSRSRAGVASMLWRTTR